MAKPIEETWGFETYGGLFVFADGIPAGPGRVDDLPVAQFFDPARGRLAAQAPAMARLLLGLLNWRPGDPSPSTPDDVRSVLQAAGVL